MKRAKPIDMHAAGERINDRIQYVGEGRGQGVYLMADRTYQDYQGTEYVKCTYCPRYTQMLSTSLCDGCYEVVSRLPDFVKHKKAFAFVAETLTGAFDLFYEETKPK